MLTMPPPLAPPALPAILMPRTPLYEILTRLRVNALAVAVDRGTRASVPRAGQDTPAGYRPPPRAPGSVQAQQLRQTLEQITREELLAAHEERETGRYARGPRFRLELLRRKAARLTTELDSISTSPRRSPSGAHLVKTPALTIVCLEHPEGITLEPEILHVSLNSQEWLALEAWRHESNDRERGAHAIYRKTGPLAIRPGLEGVAVILRAAVARAR